jgi:DNA-binding NtrC family response regulator
MRNKLMVVDDEVLILKTIKFAFEEQYDVVTFKTAQEALKALHTEKPDLVLLDLRIKSENGLEVLKKIKQHRADLEVIMMTAFGTIENTVEAMKSGAYHYLQKPLNVDEIRNLVEKAMELINARKVLHGMDGNRGLPYGLIGRSKVIENIINFIERSARTSSNVLITGESGTGKEVVAKAVHQAGKQSGGPFIAVNCSAIPLELMESELFGHVRGAFTGASEDRSGLIRLANGGTLFLDEIGEMDLKLQAKLLRAIQEREVRPVGSGRCESFDVRFIFATNRNLAAEVRAGRFREDLYFRIHVLKMDIPPLRERREDIPSLIDYIMRGIAYRDQLSMKSISLKALKIIEHYSFPGNVRELQNLVERLMVYCDDPVIDESIVNECLESSVGLTHESQANHMMIPLSSTLDEAEQMIIQKVLDHHNGNKKLTAEALGIAERTLRYKLKLLES